ncbi:signal peptidase I [Nitrosarchaeum koreense]|uniref:Signal peptidase I n=1 Tax=Nitrosarchaeum koreense MY1 TaxID=1001994 RepID=F9CXS4_9ARCH|nr:Signal peptidase I [Nitrosarchaeum koreense MY1]
MTSEKFCTKCGSELSMGDSFCTKCGNPVSPDLPEEKNTMKRQQRSPFWYLLPIFLGVLGGVAAYLILKNNDYQKAKRSLFLGIILTLIPVFIVISFEVVYGTQNPFYVIASGSMIPVLEVYDIVVIQGHVPFEEIEVDDIIVFNHPSGHDRVIVHRVASIIDDNPKTIRTKGDANPASIPGTDFPITQDEYIGKVSYVIPQAGYVTQLLKPPMNYLLYLIPLAIIFGILGFKHQKYKKSG